MEEVKEEVEVEVEVEEVEEEEEKKKKTTTTATTEKTALGKRRIEERYRRHSLLENRCPVRLVVVCRLARANSRG